MRYIKLDTKGSWDLMSPPIKPLAESPEVLSNYTKHFNLRLVQGVEMPVYEEWLPSEAQPYFAVDRDSMDRLWGEMASEIQAAYDESYCRIQCGFGKQDQENLVFRNGRIKKLEICALL